MPVIAGGLISDKEDIIAALDAGAAAISSTNPAIWFSVRRFGYEILYSRPGSGHHQLRAILFDGARPVAAAQKEFTQIYPKGRLGRA